MWGERNCLSFETSVGGIEPSSPRLIVRRSTAPSLPSLHRMLRCHIPILQLFSLQNQSSQNNPGLHLRLSFLFSILYDCLISSLIVHLPPASVFFSLHRILYETYVSITLLCCIFRFSPILYFPCDLPLNPWFEQMYYLVLVCIHWYGLNIVIKMVLWFMDIANFRDACHSPIFHHPFLSAQCHHSWLFAANLRLWPAVYIFAHQCYTVSLYNCGYNPWSTSFLLSHTWSHPNINVTSRNVHTKLTLGLLMWM